MKIGDTVRWMAYTSGGPAGEGIRTFTGTLLEVHDGLARVEATVSALRPDPDHPGAQVLRDVRVGTIEVVMNEGVQVVVAA